MPRRKTKSFQCRSGAAALFLITLFASAVAAQSKPQSSPSYDDLVQESRNGDPNVNYGQLRMAYAASPKYSSDVDMDSVKKMNSKLQSKDYKGALKAANVLLNEDYVSIDAHIVAYLAYQAQHDAGHAQQQHDIAIGLIQSILGSGDGKSIASAYKVICVREEYNVLNALGLRPQSQALSKQNDRDYDVLTVMNPKDGTTSKLYFDTTISMTYMDKLFKQ
ncbi:MAG TPA: DUF4919 domain-containing protein [Candidatus Acidoferrales bacterium]|nr:DUF4919 domain-containing protein [Candidatus Acidoferrales bacterium]